LHAALPQSPSWIRGGEGDKQGGDLGKIERETEGKGGEGRKGKERRGTRPSFEKN